MAFEGFPQVLETWLPYRGPFSPDDRCPMEAGRCPDPDGHALPLVATDGTACSRDSCSWWGSEDIIRLVPLLDTRPGTALPARGLWCPIARCSGSLDRKSDPSPGWQTF